MRCSPIWTCRIRTKPSRAASFTNEITRFGRVLSVTLAPYGALDGEGGVIAVIHDVTEQRRLDDARREFVANVTHELRTPLTNIRSYTETLLDAAGELPLDTESSFWALFRARASAWRVLSPIC